MARKNFVKEVERARWLVRNVRFAAMATVNNDGSPHNTPYLFMSSDDLKEMYWGSHPDSQHSKNIEQTGRLFIVLYEANERGGLYIRCENARIAQGEELKRALAVHNQIRERNGSKPKLTTDYYQSPNPQRMYVADTKKFWVNYEVRDKDGLVIEDKRHEVSRKKLSEKDVVYVDKDNKEIGSGSLDQAIHSGIVVRVVRVHVFNDKGQLLLQKRADDDDSFPGRWDSSAGGHVDVGESLETTAVRELDEEIGVKNVTLKLVSTIYTEESDGDFTKKRFNTVYTASYNGPVNIDNDEVTDYRWVGLETLKKEIDQSVDNFTPGLIAALKLNATIIS